MSSRILRMPVVACLLAWGGVLCPVPGRGATPRPGVGLALIIAGLPGDPGHEKLFEATVRAWEAWLIGPLGFAPDSVRVLSGSASGAGPGRGAATRESIAREVEALRARAGPGDRVWVFVLGHANLDEGHGFLHLPGPDLRDDEFGALFRGLGAREQVFWMTTAASGSFLRGLAKPGRIVVAATGPVGEPNETEFPHALAEVARRPARQLDLDQDGRVSVREVFATTSAAVEARFAGDERVPTEHARLDDTGDGIGVEAGSLEKSAKADGSLASRTFLPRVEAATPPTPPSRSDHGPNRAAAPAR